MLLPCLHLDNGAQGQEEKVRIPYRVIGGFSRSSSLLSAPCPLGLRHTEAPAAPERAVHLPPVPLPGAALLACTVWLTPIHPSKPRSKTPPLGKASKAFSLPLQSGLDAAFSVLPFIIILKTLYCIVYLPESLLHWPQLLTGEGLCLMYIYLCNLRAWYRAAVK